MTEYKLTLDHPVTYEIIVPGQLDVSWSEWVEGLNMTFSCVDNVSVTKLTCTVDQAALLGLLRRLYFLGVPLISVAHVDYVPCNETDSRS